MCILKSGSDLGTRPTFSVCVTVIFLSLSKALQDDDDDEPAETAPEPPSRPHPSQLAPKPAPRKPPMSGGSSSTSPQKGASGGSGGGNVQVVGDRLELYKQALKQAEAAGEGAKARRYKRSIASLEQVRGMCSGGGAMERGKRRGEGERERE